MERGMPLSLGVTTPSTDTYEGRHRDNTMLRGVGFIPLGDRDRAKPEYGENYLEERESIDKYSKYYS